jgi:hypothetical protein
MKSASRFPPESPGGEDMFGLGKNRRRQAGEEPQKPSADPFRVKDVFPKKIDSLGREIAEVYAKEGHYAVYLASVPHWQRVRYRMFVQYADDQATHLEQAGLIDDLLPLRDKVEYLSDDLRNAVFYQRRLATSLKLALDGKKDDAKESLNALINSATVEREARGRRTYLQAAVPIALIAAAVLIVIGGPLRHGAAHVGSLLLSGGGGALGALLSIAIAFSERSVAPDYDFKTNALDGSLRVLIGVISGVAFNLFLSAGFLNGIVPIGSQTEGLRTSTVIWWPAALALGIVAGFAERFMPDLITKFASQPGAQTAAAPATGGASATPPATKPPAGPSPTVGQASQDDENLDGCEVNASEAEATPDDHLPAATGGVATGGVK